MIYIQRQAPPHFFLELPIRRQQVDLLHDWLRLPETNRPAPPPLAPRYAAVPTVLAHLGREFGGKCAFCEQQLSVDQQKLTFFRPLKQALQKPERNGGVAAAHYYAWLIGDWSNLYLTCEICRNKHGAEFPTYAERAKPELNHLARANAQPYFIAEQPLLIDPCVEAPAQHIAFTERGLAIPREGSPIGQKTIEIFYLNRPSLQEMRAATAHQFKTRWLAAYDLSRQGVTGERGPLADLLSELLAACDHAAPFAGMKRHLLLEWIDYEKNAAATPQRVINALNGVAWQKLVTQVQKLLYPANALLRLDRESTYLLRDLVELHSPTPVQAEAMQLQVMVLTGNHSDIVFGDKVLRDKVATGNISVASLKGSEVDAKTVARAKIEIQSTGARGEQSTFINNVEANPSFTAKEKSETYDSDIIQDKVAQGDEIYSDKIHGDKIHGDKITIGDISGQSHVAIGHNANSIATKDSIVQALSNAGDVNNNFFISTSAQTRHTPVAINNMIEEPIRLDVAYQDTVKVYESFWLAVAVRQPNSPLLVITDLETIASESGSIWRSEQDSLIRYRVEIEALDFELWQNSYIFSISVGKNSRPHFFLMRATKEGKLPITINAYQVSTDEMVAQTRLQISAFIQALPISATDLATGFKQKYAKDDEVLFTSIYQQISSRQEDSAVSHNEIHQIVKWIEQEVSKGEAANPDKIKRWMNTLYNITPDIFSALIVILKNPAVRISSTILNIVHAWQR